MGGGIVGRRLTEGQYWGGGEDCTAKKVLTVKINFIVESKVGHQTVHKTQLHF